MFFLTYKKNIEASSAKSVPIAVPIAVHTVYFCDQLIYIHQQQEVFLKSLQIQAILFWIFYVLHQQLVNQIYHLSFLLKMKVTLTLFKQS